MMEVYKNKYDANFKYSTFMLNVKQGFEFV